ncbi:ethanolamine utilization protein EutJ [Paenibacillus lautus]|uniref:ethanolamine utilization protein EutJ n=1 Tax=Paenibacillus lautus TaxID=1401 RepID=UPI003D2E1F3C
MPETKPFAYCDQLVKQFEAVIQKPIPGRSSFYYTGVDLGTACVVLTVLDDTRKPVAGAYRYADVVRDGMVVDYLGAIQIVRELKAQLEQQLGAELEYAASAIPPGTDLLDAGAIKHVIQGAGFEVTALLDEPTAANAVLQISNGAIVDIGGGTTGISILKDGKVVYVADEATGGTHFSLVIAGAYQMSFSEADLFKRDPAHHQELLPLLRPVIDKVASIVNRHVVGHEVKELYLVGGTCCLSGMEAIIEQKTGIATYKPSNPLFVTPLGIALNCTREAM